MAATNDDKDALQNFCESEMQEILHILLICVDANQEEAEKIKQLFIAKINVPNRSEEPFDLKIKSTGIGDLDLGDRRMPTNENRHRNAMYKFILVTPELLGNLGNHDVDETVLNNFKEKRIVPLFIKDPDDPSWKVPSWLTAIKGVIVPHLSDPNKYPRILSRIDKLIKSKKEECEAMERQRESAINQRREDEMSKQRASKEIHKQKMEETELDNERRTANIVRDLQENNDC